MRRFPARRAAVSRRSASLQGVDRLPHRHQRDRVKASCRPRHDHQDPRRYRPGHVDKVQGDQRGGARSEPCPVLEANFGRNEPSDGTRDLDRRRDGLIKVRGSGRGTRLNTCPVNWSVFWQSRETLALHSLGTRYFYRSGAGIQRYRSITSGGQDA